MRANLHKLELGGQLAGNRPDLGVVAKPLHTVPVDGGREWRNQLADLCEEVGRVLPAARPMLAPLVVYEPEHVTPMQVALRAWGERPLVAVIARWDLFHAVARRGAVVAPLLLTVGCGREDPALVFARSLPVSRVKALAVAIRGRLEPESVHLGKRLSIRRVCLVGAARGESCVGAVPAEEASVKAEPSVDRQHATLLDVGSAVHGWRIRHWEWWARRSGTRKEHRCRRQLAT
mmetsp:Transcript_48870/g.104326  ORF Transcript_48870/g.104326 Transcript_48870/m.104326 type:complete len:233 (+) Transcript_48870:554-1252(+)